MTPALRTRFLLIENPAAGGARKRIVTHTLEALESAGCNLRRVATCHPGHATKLAAQAAAAGGLDGLIVAGGDGTIREAACGLLNTDLPLGIIPAGTGNVLAYELGLSRAPAALASYLMRGRAVSITGGEANGQFFLLMAGIGIDAEIQSRLSPVLKRYLGKAAYGPAIVKALMAGHGPRLTAIGANGRQTGGWMIVAKSSHYGGPFVVTRQAGIARDGLQLVVARATSRFSAITELAALAAGYLDRLPGVTVTACGKIRIEADTPARVQIDGDVIGTTPVNIGPAKAPLNLIIPADAGDNFTGT